MALSCTLLFLRYKHSHIHCFLNSFLFVQFKPVVGNFSVFWRNLTCAMSNYVHVFHTSRFELFTIRVYQVYHSMHNTQDDYQMIIKNPIKPIIFVSSIFLLNKSTLQWQPYKKNLFSRKFPKIKTKRTTPSIKALNVIRIVEPNCFLPFSYCSQWTAFLSDVMHLSKAERPVH